jgi:hypothetical protein
MIIPHNGIQHLAVGIHMSTIGGENFSWTNWDALSWRSVRFELSPRLPFGTHSSALVVLNALVKSVKPQMEPESGRPLKLAFHIPEVANHRFRRRPGEPFSLEVLFFGGGVDVVSQWLNALSAHLVSHSHANFDLASVPCTKSHRGTDLLRPADANDTHAEQEFLSPLPFKRDNSFWSLMRSWEIPLGGSPRRNSR